MSMKEEQHAHTEAAIYAEGTRFTADELFAEWKSAVAKDPDAHPQAVYEAFLKANPEGVMQEYLVAYLEEPGDDMDWTFECQAEDEAHAKEQCEDAYPGCVVLHVSAVDSKEARS